MDARFRGHDKVMKLVIGLGNPGLKYRKTRHNVGFLAVDSFSKKNKRSLNKEIVILKPQLFMNNSGAAVAKAIRKFRVGVRDALVVCDDINLALGMIRFRSSGSAGGHRGLQSIIDELGAGDFNRLRIGIGVDPFDFAQGQSRASSGLEAGARRGIDKGAVLRDYVLSKFTSGERKVLQEVLDRSAEAISVWIEDGIEVAMNRFNKKNLSVIASEPQRAKQSPRNDRFNRR